MRARAPAPKVPRENGTAAMHDREQAGETSAPPAPATERAAAAQEERSAAGAEPVREPPAQAPGGIRAVPPALGDPVRVSPGSDEKPVAPVHKEERPAADGLGSPAIGPPPPPPPPSALSQPGLPESPPPPPSVQLLLESLGRSTPPLETPRPRRVFVNRTMRMDQIEVIGFDMDYTLALYNQPRMEALSARCTLEKMVALRGYPEAILSLQYDSQRAIRGLVIDREAGNILKMDRYGYVGRGYHGSRPLSRAERARLYREQQVRVVPPRFSWIDTLFALPEAVLYGALVDFFEQDPAFRALPPAEQGARYDRMWVDIRASIDEAHQDDSIKRVIKQDLAGYFDVDPELAPTLHRFRAAGKKLFLLTNSAFDYTQAVMTHLLSGQLPDYPTWRDYFDVIIVSARKPAFFVDSSPIVELDEAGLPAREVPEREPLLRGRVYQGGNVRALDQQMGLRGDRVLYIGDHIYGDMLRAKRSSVWRTAMIIQELEEELVFHARVEDSLQRLEATERRRTRIDAELRYQQMLMDHLRRLQSGPDEALRALGQGGAAADDGPDASAQSEAIAETLRAAGQELERRLAVLRAAQKTAVEDVDRLEQEIEQTFNPHWGPLFKEGTENSRLGEQVEDYACLYTSRVSNFLAYSPFQYFRSPRDHLPHERVY